MAYNGNLFNPGKKTEDITAQLDLEKLVEIQMEQLHKTYDTECLDVKQLQKVLNVGETNARQWVKNCQKVWKIGNRKVVSIAWVARYLGSTEKHRK